MNKRNHRERLYHEQGGLCFYCKQPMILMPGPFGKRAPGKMATLEHLQPISKGGRRSPSLNCVAACVSCNQKRGTRSVAKFIAWRRMIDAKYGRVQAQTPDIPANTPTGAET